ncbi:MAG: nucleotidyltransferase family protein [Victivallaceae bacterium]|nr:nucleotidyltransferase family protein [Victivallaceae bacterium]
MSAELLPEILSGNTGGIAWGELSAEAWTELWDFARCQRVDIILYAILRRNKIAMPGSRAQDMRNKYHGACALDFRRRQQLEEIIRLFNANDVEHILLKGSALIYTVYDCSYARPMCDIDLLVRREDGLRAYDLLADHGYFNTFGGHEKLKGDFNHHYPPLYRRNLLPVEIHTSLLNGYRINPAGIRARSRPLRIGKLTTRIMGPEDQIIHVALHKLFQGMGMNGILGLYDIIQIIRTNEIDWSALKQLTGDGEYHNVKCLFLALHLVRKLFKVPVDEAFLAAIRPESFTPEIEATALKLLFSMTSDWDPEVFSFGVNIADIGNGRWKTVLSRFFMSPYAIAMYGSREYGNGNFTFRNLSVLYVKRTFSLLQRYGPVLLRHLLAKNRNNAPIEFGVSGAELKSWLLQ